MLILLASLPIDDQSLPVKHTSFSTKTDLSKPEHTGPEAGTSLNAEAQDLRVLSPPWRPSTPQISVSGVQQRFAGSKTNTPLMRGLGLASPFTRLMWRAKKNGP